MQAKEGAPGAPGAVHSDGVHLQYISFSLVNSHAGITDQ
jgi:hypothetical protein